MTLINSNHFQSNQNNDVDMTFYAVCPTCLWSYALAIKPITKLGMSHNFKCGNCGEQFITSNFYQDISVR